VAAETYHYRQEASQPPLYYLLSAGLVRLLGLRADDVAVFQRLNPWVACGPGAADLYGNRAVLHHDPNREAFPWRSTLLTLHVLRIWSTLLQVVTVLGTYALARLAFPRRRLLGLLAMAVVAFNPQFLLVTSGVNNDNLVTPLAAVGLYLLLQTWRDGPSAWRSMGLGVLVGLAGLSKLSGWLLLPLSTILLLIRAYRPPTLNLQSPVPNTQYQIPNTQSPISTLLPTIAHLLLVVLASLAVGGWWFWRNWQLYGDLTGLRPMLALVGVRGSLQASAPLPLMEAGLMFRSFWGQIPCAFYPPTFYAFYGVVAALSLGGLAWGWRRLAAAERAVTTIVAGWFLLVVVSWVRWDVMTPAPGGRLLFPALPAVALLIALGIGVGISDLAQGRLTFVNGLLIGLLGLVACWTVARILPRFFAPPPRYSDAGAVQPAQSLDATLGDGIRLLGYDVALDERGPALDVTLYWQALAVLVEDYTLALQLVSPVPGDTTLRWNYNSWPGRGNYPTSAWQPGEVISDRYRFLLPEADFPTQAWDVHLVLYQGEGQNGRRLPVRVAGQDAGDRLVLARFRVPGVPPSCPEEDRLGAQVHFGEAVALTHASVALGSEEQDGRAGTRVTLCWEALQPLSADYTVFVHLEDVSGALVGTGDGPPMEGAFPTSLWRPGDVVLDVHDLAPTSEGGEARAGGGRGGRISVGLYGAGDGLRLPAYVEGTPVPNAAVPVWPDRP
jgi:hypothetical protein